MFANDSNFGDIMLMVAMVLRKDVSNDNGWPKVADCQYP